MATVVLNAENASYMVITKGNNVYVTTYGYKTAADGCKFLQNKGINAIRVVDYAESKENGGIGAISEKNC